MTTRRSIPWLLLQKAEQRVAVLETCAGCDRPFLAVLGNGDAVPEACLACTRIRLRKESYTTVKRAGGERE